MVTFEDISLFERALNGELSKEENEVFSKRLAKDSDFKENYEKFKQIVGDIKQQQNYQDLMVVLNESYKSRDWSASTEGIETERPRFLICGLCILGIIAAIIITFFITRAYYADESVAEESIEQSPTVDDQAEEIGVAEEADAEVVTEEEEPAEEVTTDVNPTAFMISQGGYFLTQYQPISEAKSLRLRQNDTIEYRAEVVLTDLALDVAILHVSNSAEIAGNRLPYRLATTQAFAGTEVMAVVRSGDLSHESGSILALESNDTFDHYDVDLTDGELMAGGPVISRNGNIVAMVTVSPDGEVNYVKSTHLVGLLARNADAAGLREYMPAASNNLAGLERSAQLERIEPFVLEVIRFY